MSRLDGPKGPSGGTKESSFRAIVVKLRKRHILGTLAAFIGGGWLLVEVVERVLVSRCLNQLFLAEKDPFLINIRGEERFKKLRERVKYEWEHFEV